MSADTVMAKAREAVSGRGHGRRPRRPVPEVIASVLQRDVCGVRLGVLLLVMPLVMTNLALQLTSRQGWNQ